MFYRIDSGFIESVEMINGSAIQWKQLLKCCLDILALQGNLLFKIIFVIDNKTAQMSTFLVDIHNGNMVLVIFICCNLLNNIYRRKVQQKVKKFTH